MASIRRATLADADAIGSVHVEAWQAAYRGIMPDSYLDGLDPERRARLWRDRLRDPEPDRDVLVAMDAGAVVGFTLFGRQRGGAAVGTGELYSLNLTPAAWGRGIGSQLLRRAEDELAGQGYDRAILWVAERNDRARRFYEQHGWSPTGQHRTQELLGVLVEEVGYGRALPSTGNR